MDLEGWFGLLLAFALIGVFLLGLYLGELLGPSLGVPVDLLGFLLAGIGVWRWQQTVGWLEAC